MTFKEKIKSLCSNKEEFDKLNQLSNIYIIEGKEPDDNNLAGLYNDIDDRHLSFCTKLRGPKLGPYKIRNGQNDHTWFHGYLLGVSEENVKGFEEELFFQGLKHGYQYKKIINTTRQEFEKHFDSLFKVVGE